MENRARSAFLLLVVVAFVPGILSEGASTLEVNRDSNSKIVSPTTPAVTSTDKNVNNSTVSKVEEQKSNDSNKEVQVELYYEAMCSDSVQFVEQELLPIYSEFSKFINVQYIPFGKGNITKDNGNLNFTCLFDSDCRGDAIQACAVSKINDSVKLLEFINCSLVEGIKKKPVSIEKCGNDSKIDTDVIDSITKCLDNSEWHSLFENYHNMSTNANVKSVPKIVINKNYTENIPTSHFKNTLCNKISSKPDTCKNIDNGSGRIVVGVFPILIGLYYIINIMF